jgi:prepilin-type N-terminal cleavage/methylation domain-containing protein
MIKNKAFTYVELMLVATIIAILAAIAIPNFLEARTRSVVARSKAELAALAMAAEAYRLDARAWPINRQPGTPAPWDLTALTTPVPYLVSLPLDAMTLPDAQSRHPAGAPSPIPYRYFNALLVNPEEGLKIVDQRGDEPVRRMRPLRKAEQKTEQKLKVFDNSKLGGGVIAGLFWGYGPDVVRPDNTMPPATQILKRGEVQIVNYDPSNGTTSEGDIYQRVP